jgi:serine/threonine-protein kinase
MARTGPHQSAGANGTRFGESQAGAATSQTPGTTLKEGAVIDGKYRLDSLLGEGGMGTVWAARNLQLDVAVAIKLLRPGRDQALLSERLKIEARAAARLVHPAIVRIFDVDTSEAGDPFIVMELLKGESLASVMDRGRLSGESAVQLLLPIAEGLGLAHARGIVHRDLKPQNVHLAEDGERIQPKLLDFGIAKLMSGALPSGNLTETGVTVGSPDYMSPEQARGSNDVDHRADVWSFCVVLYEAVTGATPFEGDNYNALMRAIVEDEPAPLDADIDPGLSELISWGLAKDRSLRPGSIQELGRELARWLIDRGVNEDVCGASLGPKWITRVAQKSAPVIMADAPDGSKAPLVTTKPPPIVRSDTLVSPRYPSLIVRDSTPQVGGTASKKPRSLRPWLIVGGLLLVGVGSAWALSGSGASSVPTPAVSVVVVPAASVLEPLATSRSEAAPSPVQIATTAPEPPSVPAKPASRNSTPDSSNSASRSAGSVKARDGKIRSDADKAAPAAQPARDEHDERRELLQAY